MLIEAAHPDLRIKEVPINVRYDVDGSTQNPVFHGFNVLNSILGLISQKRPLSFFGIPGVLLLLVASFFCFAVLSSFNDTHQVAIGYAMIFVLSTVLGIFCIFTGLMLWSITSLRDKL